MQFHLRNEDQVWGQVESGSIDLSSIVADFATTLFGDSDQNEMSHMVTEVNQGGAKSQLDFLMNRMALDHEDILYFLLVADLLSDDWYLDDEFVDELEF